MIASIPSPSRGIVQIGPLPLHAYGLMLAIGVIVATMVAERRWARMGGDPKFIGQIAIWVIVAGVVGARVYHLFTGYDWTRDGIGGTVKIWNGGLSIWGAVAGGAIAVVVLTRRHHVDTLAMCDALAPGVALAQAIGRWGNYFNQELFGRPTSLPWGLKIDPANRPAGYERFATFHPSFLYESLWMIAVFLVLVWAERAFRFRRGQTFALYVMLYTSYRVFEEWLRIDKATKIFGIRFNAILAASLFVASTCWFLWLRRHGRPNDAPLSTAPDDDSAVGAATPSPNQHSDLG